MLNRAFQILPILCDANDGIHDIMECLPGMVLDTSAARRAAKKTEKKVCFWSDCRIKRVWLGAEQGSTLNGCQRLSTVLSARVNFSEEGVESLGFARLAGKLRQSGPRTRV
jgi:hypothetical protein